MHPILSACGICTTYPCLVEGGASFDGVCVDNPDMLDYVCYCDDWWIGKDCETATACEPEPCLNGGTCSDDDDLVLYSRLFHNVEMWLDHSRNSLKLFFGV